MPASDYPFRIRIEAPTRTKNPDGQPVLTWPADAVEPFARVWANVVISGGDQSTPHRQQQAEVSAVITCRSTAQTRSVTPGMRIRFRDETYHITSAEDVEFRKREVIIKATSKRAP